MKTLHSLRLSGNTAGFLRKCAPLAIACCSAFVGGLLLCRIAFSNKPPQRERIQIAPLRKSDRLALDGTYRSVKENQRYQTELTIEDRRYVLKTIQNENRLGGDLGAEEGRVSVQSVWAEIDSGEYVTFYLSYRLLLEDDAGKRSHLYTLAWDTDELALLPEFELTQWWGGGGFRSSTSKALVREKKGVPAHRPAFLPPPPKPPLPGSP